jgi:hypothetical protein
VLELRVELDYARKLIQFSETILSGTHHASNGEFTRKDYVPLTLICKACATFEGIVLLVQHGNSDDSLSLLRTLVESTVNSAYLWLKGDESADLFADFRSFREWIEYRDLNALEPMLTSYLTPEEAREMESHFVELRPKFKNQNEWCTEGLFQRAVYVDEQITSRLKDRLSPADFEEKIRITASWLDCTGEQVARLCMGLQRLCEAACVSVRRARLRSAVTVRLLNWLGQCFFPTMPCSSCLLWRTTSWGESTVLNGRGSTVNISCTNPLLPSRELTCGARAGGAPFEAGTKSGWPSIRTKAVSSTNISRRCFWHRFFVTREG